MTFEQGERQSLASQQRPCLLSAAAAADIGGCRDYSRQRSLRTSFYKEEMYRQVLFLEKNVYLCKRYGELLSSHGQEEQA